MWRNEQVAKFVEWMRQHNEKPERKARENDIAALITLTGQLTHSFANYFKISPSCEEEVVRVLSDLVKKHGEYISKHLNDEEAEELFQAQISALVVRDAEEYYLCMMGSGSERCNSRDTHMINTLQILAKRFERTRGGKVKVVVWLQRLQIGTLQESLKQKTVENVFHIIAEEPNFLLLFTRTSPEINQSPRPWLQISQKNSKQFDAVIHIDQTSALKPLDKVEKVEPEELVKIQEIANVRFHASPAFKQVDVAQFYRNYKTGSLM
ncbi:8732_t:CDS:2 [Ambispora gerdemannii]|uniref:8732_t:CDS:1 n=1 Tax=Ambispora gerdemannii TaxID=144530 RepID=A0A9N9BWZ0_9GLOM|nr:8732_t:CDS:2 [Ambispora gerdemannii]